MPPLHLVPSIGAASVVRARPMPHLWLTMRRDHTRRIVSVSSRRAVEQLLGLLLQLDPDILVRLVARNSRDPLHEIEQRFRRPAFLAQHRVDDPRRIRTAEAAILQKACPLLVAARDDPLAGGA